MNIIECCTRWVDEWKILFAAALKYNFAFLKKKSHSARKYYKYSSRWILITVKKEGWSSLVGVTTHSSMSFAYLLS